MKKAPLSLLFLFATSATWAQGYTSVVDSHIINGTDVTHEYSDAVLTLDSEETKVLNSYGDGYIPATVYELEIKLNDAGGNHVETIVANDGAYAGGYAIYFDSAVFQHIPGMEFRVEYYQQNSEDNSSVLTTLYFYDTDSDSTDPYAVLELSRML